MLRLQTGEIQPYCTILGRDESFVEQAYGRLQATGGSRHAVSMTSPVFHRALRRLAKHDHPLDAVIFRRTLDDPTVATFSRSGRWYLTLDEVAQRRTRSLACASVAPV